MENYSSIKLKLLAEKSAVTEKFWEFLEITLPYVPIIIPLIINRLLS